MTAVRASQRARGRRGQPPSKPDDMTAGNGAPGADASVDARSTDVSPLPDEDDADDILFGDGDDLAAEDLNASSDAPRRGVQASNRLMERYGAEPAPEDDTPFQERMKLTAPPPREGFRQKWIRVAWRDGTADAANISAAYNDGWRPRDPDTVPGGHYAPTMNHGNFGQCIEVEGMILMERYEWMAQREEQYYERRTDQLDDAVKTDLRQVAREGGIPITAQHKSVVTVRRRRPPAQGE